MTKGWHYMNEVHNTYQIFKTSSQKHLLLISHMKFVVQFLSFLFFHSCLPPFLSSLFSTFLSSSVCYMFLWQVCPCVCWFMSLCTCMWRLEVDDFGFPDLIDQIKFCRIPLWQDYLLSKTGAGLAGSKSSSLSVCTTMLGYRCPYWSQFCYLKLRHRIK